MQRTPALHVVRTILGSCAGNLHGEFNGTKSYAVFMFDFLKNITFVHLTHVWSKRVPLSNEDEWGWEDNARTKRDLEAGNGNETLGREEINSVLMPPPVSVSDRTLKTNNLKRPGFASSSSNGNGNGNGTSPRSLKAHSKKISPSRPAKNPSPGKPI